MNKKMLFFVMFIMVAGCCVCYADKTEIFNVRFPLPGKSIASPLLQKDTLPVVHIASSRLAGSCRVFSVIDTQVTLPLQNGVIKDGYYVSGNWNEAWTTTCDGTKIQVPIGFVLDGKGETDYFLKLEDAKIIK